MKDDIWRAYESLITLGQEAAYYQDISSFDTRDNNRAARLAAQWDGSPLAFIEMCEQSQKDWDQTLEVEHGTGSQQLIDSIDVEPQKNRNQCLTIYQVTEGMPEEIEISLVIFCSCQRPLHCLKSRT